MLCRNHLYIYLNTYTYFGGGVDFQLNILHIYPWLSHIHAAGILDRRRTKTVAEELAESKPLYSRKISIDESHDVTEKSHDQAELRSDATLENNEEQENETPDIRYVLFHYPDVILCNHFNESNLKHINSSHETHQF